MPAAGALLQSIANPPQINPVQSFQQGAINQQNIMRNQQLMGQDAAMNPLRQQELAQQIQQQGILGPLQAQAFQQNMQIQAQQEERQRNADLLKQNAYDAVTLSAMNDEDQVEYLKQMEERYSGTPFADVAKTLKTLGFQTRSKKIGESIATFQLQGLLPLPKEVDLEVAKYAKMMGLKPGDPEYQRMAAESYKAYLEKQTKSGVSVTTNVGGEPDPYVTKLKDKVAEKVAEDYQKSVEVAKRATKSFSNIQTASKLLDSGVFTGMGYQIKYNFGKALQLAGINLFENEISNTEAFVATMAKETAVLIKDFGAGTGLSDADRDFAKESAGGNLNMSEAGIRRIIMINQKLMWQEYQQYKKERAYIMSATGVEPPLVELPAGLTEAELAGQPWMNLTGRNDDVLNSAPSNVPVPRRLKDAPRAPTGDELKLLKYNPQTGQITAMWGNEEVNVPYKMIPRDQLRLITSVPTKGQ